MAKAKPQNIKMMDVTRKLKMEMEWLKKSGLTLDQIGKVYNVSKQRVHQIIND